jgi:4-carboxymuconolactone decarboxylase
MNSNTDFGTFGRFVETPVSEMPEDMRQAYDFTLKLRGLVPGPHKIWLANPALSRTIVPTGGYFQTVSLTLMAYDVPSDAVGLDQ